MEPLRRPTLLHRFLILRNIKTGTLAQESGYCRQHINRLRQGTAEPTRIAISAIVEACRRLTGEPLRAADLFHLGDDGPA